MRFGKTRCDFNWNSSNLHRFEPIEIQMDYPHDRHTHMYASNCDIFFSQFWACLLRCIGSWCFFVFASSSSSLFYSISIFSSTFFVTLPKCMYKLAEMVLSISVLVWIKSSLNYQYFQLYNTRNPFLFMNIPIQDTIPLRLHPTPSIAYFLLIVKTWIEKMF